MMPYPVFMEHFGNKPEWKPFLENKDSSLFKLFAIENLFVKQKRLHDHYPSGKI